MQTLQRNPAVAHRITWQKLPSDFILPDEPVESTLQPLLAAALRESLELAGLILESMIIASNFGICANVDGKTVVKAPDWVYIPCANPSAEVRRSYTPHAEGGNAEIVMEFISATEGTEYSINPNYPYGKWYFYEQILKIPVYAIFHPPTGILEVYRLQDGKYQIQEPDPNHLPNQLFWLESIGLFLGVWEGQKAENQGYWLRWWDQSGNLLLWGHELIEQQRQLVEEQRQLTEEQRQLKEQAEQRANYLAEKLRSLGVEP
ncbi:MAG: Uma2 family endonuclease [Pseudanabaenaceae cyanobacterium bins.39]|nr:Uma2 family endonuclease [Pseudanabaenaceae cyanobacterium bins.39]